MMWNLLDAREWTTRAERAARHLQRRPDTRYRRFLESTIAAASGVVREARASVTKEQPGPNPRPGRCA